MSATINVVANGWYNNQQEAVSPARDSALVAAATNRRDSARRAEERLLVSGMAESRGSIHGYATLF